MPKYEEIKVLDNDIVMRYNDDGSISSFMKDPANSDYQAYLKSLDEASTL
jgi:hypothetical protein